jgi:nicotinic acid mononucleotide adenylyltransferase
MKFTYKSINYTVTSLNGFHIHNDTRYVRVVGSDGTKRISEYSKVKPFIFDNDRSTTFNTKVNG